MYKLEIEETEFDFCGLSGRDVTDMIVIHHTGNGEDVDADAESIHRYHLSIGYLGIGYHFVVRKDGTIERGRPEWAEGSHAYGENHHTLGIHLSGDFTFAEPTEKQIENTALLIAHLCTYYSIPMDRAHIVGHREVNSDTDCPGNNLQKLLDEIVGKAIWYTQNPVY